MKRLKARETQRKGGTKRDRQRKRRGPTGRISSTIQRERTASKEAETHFSHVDSAGAPIVVLNFPAPQLPVEIWKDEAVEVVAAAAE